MKTEEEIAKGKIISGYIAAIYFCLYFWIGIIAIVKHLIK